MNRTNFQGRSFRGQLLRGKNFSHANLTAADFSQADIRGANFTKAILQSANFSHARAGHQPYWIPIAIAISLCLAILAGAILGLSGVLASGMLQPYFTQFADYTIAPGLITLTALAVFCLVTVQQGFLLGLTSMTVVLAGLSALIGTIAGILPGVGASALVMALVALGTLVDAIAVGAIVALAETRLAILLGVESLALAVAVSVSEIIAQTTSGVPGTIIQATSGISPSGGVECQTNEVVRQLAARVGACNLAHLSIALGRVGTLAVVLAALLAAIAIGLGGYTAWHSIAGNEKFTFTRAIVVALAAIGGTSFWGSNLTAADFTGATLRNTDLRADSIDRTNWFQAKGLDLARLGQGYLQNPQIRHLVITKKGQNQIFDGEKMPGVNLSGASLEDASLIGADLSGADLARADLSRAKLVRARLDRTDFTGACLTGAFIEDWGLTTETILQEVKCDYIYTRLPTPEDPDPGRKPDNKEETFARGDFADFIYPLVETLDLYHKQDINPQAIAAAFNYLAKAHPEADLEIVALERRGSLSDRFLLRAKTAPDADRSQLEAEYFAEYDRLKGLATRQLLQILSQRDERIRMLTGIVNTALNRPEPQSPDPPAISVGKRVALIVADGSFDRGFPVTLQIGEEGMQPTTRLLGSLPPDAEMPQYYERWRSSYRRLGSYFRLKRKATQVKTVSIGEDCCTAALMLENRLNQWLRAETFRPLREKLLQKLTEGEEIRVIIQAENQYLRRLPWHLWDWLSQYRQAEVALGALNHERVERSTPARTKIRILAVLGHSAGIDTETDQKLLQELPHTEIVFLPEPTRREFDQTLWDRQGWDILCFAGHSESEPDRDNGWLYLNDKESLTIEQIKNALLSAIERGLKMAIFNSCDGLGLAGQLADLHVPQIVVMREPVPDRVAQEFLKHFLSAFAGGKSLYLAVREARARLQALEAEFPCATWMPVICQNPSEKSWSWPEMRAINQAKIEQILNQLQAAIAADPDLKPSDRTDALEQVKTLIVAAEHPTEPEAQSLAKTAIAFLKGMLDELPSTSTLAIEFQRLLPFIETAL